MESSGVKSPGFIINMALYLMLLAAFLGLLAFIFALTYVPALKLKIQGILRKILESTFWNNTIRSISLSYLETGKVFWVQARLYKAAGDSFPVLKCYPLVIFMVGYPVICAWAVMHYRDRLNDKSIKDRIF